VNESLDLDRIRRKSAGRTEWLREEAPQSRSSRQPMFFFTLGGFLQVPEITLRNRKTGVPMSFEVRPGALSLPS